LVKSDVIYNVEFCTKIKDIKFIVIFPVGFIMFVVKRGL